MVWGALAFLTSGSALADTLAPYIAAPLYLVVGDYFYKSMWLGSEMMWKFTGIYALFGVSGMPIREKFLENEEQK